MSEQSKRRDVLKAVLGLTAVLPAARLAAAVKEPAKARPQAGDRFVFFSGDKKGEVITPADLPVGGPQVMAWPVDESTNTVRSGSRLNQVILIRFPPEELSGTASANGADGVVAYSAVCTHQACPVSMWQKENGTLFCSCHGSQFDPKDAARVVAGPAPRKLAMLPLKIESGELVAAGPFTSRVGGEKQ